jgi:hypothetical protein
MLFLELSAALPLLALDPFAFGKRQHLFVLDPQFSAMQLKVIHSLDDLSRLLCGGEVCKCKPSEDTIVEVVVECVRERQSEVGHELNQLLLFDRKGYVLDDDSRGDELLINVVRVLVLMHACVEQRIWVVVAQAGQCERRKSLRLVKPSLIPK